MSMKPEDRNSDVRIDPSGLLQIPVIGSIACGDQRLNCSMRGSMEPRTEQFSRALIAACYGSNYRNS